MQIYSLSHSVYGTKEKGEANTHKKCTQYTKKMIILRSTFVLRALDSFAAARRKEPKKKNDSAENRRFFLLLSVHNVSLFFSFGFFFASPRLSAVVMISVVTVVRNCLC